MLCLPKELTNKFLTGFKDGSINPQDLSKMTSADRHVLFEGIVGRENAKNVNALFEEKMLLKDQQLGMITWAKEVAGLKPEIRKDIISRISKLDKVLNPAEQEAFLNDLASKKLGTDVTVEEAKRISDLAKQAREAKVAMSAGGDRMEYGRARVALENYMNDLKSNIKTPLTASKVVNAVAGTAKSLKASMDNSAIFRQGWKTMWTNPQIWLKNASQSFVDLAESVGGKAVMNEVNADIVSRPTYDLMKEAKLAIGTVEEAYPSSFPGKIPFLGRLYKASEETYTAFIYRTRADIFDKYIKIAKRTGVDVEDRKQLESIGKLVNSLTGRGNLGRAEPAADVFNSVFFSPRFMKSHIDVLTAHIADTSMTAFAKKQAALNLLKYVSGTAAILATANAIHPGSVELDPRSSDFGKIKIGPMRFDVAGGAEGVVTLAARLLTMSTKSTTTGKITKLNSGDYGSKTGFDVLIDFGSNKLSPVGSVVKDFLKGRDFDGNRPTVLGELNNLLTPLPITNYMELRKNAPNNASVLAGIILDGLGLSTTAYSSKKPPKLSKKPRNLMQILGITKPK